jgi:hypothetical protein
MCSEGFLVDPRKIMAILNMLMSRNVIEIKWLLVTAGFYQRYLQDFVSKTTPMCKLLKKDETFDWTNSCTKALQWMKSSMTCFLVSIVPNWRLEFHMHIDVSNFALTIMLGPNSNNKIYRPIYYARWLMSSIKRNYTTTEKEALAMIYAIKKLLHYLLGNNFVFYVDH